eukprot:38790_1
MLMSGLFSCKYTRLNLELIVITHWIRTIIDFSQFPRDLMQLIITLTGKGHLKQTCIAFEMDYTQCVSYNHALIQTPKTTILSPSISSIYWNKFVYKITVYEISNNTAIGWIVGDLNEMLPSFPLDSHFTAN